MNLDDELARLRRRLTEVENALDRRPPDPILLGSGQVVQTVAGPGTYPTAASSMFPVQNVRISGPDVEGGAVTMTPTGSTFYAANVGSAVPPVGTDLLAIRSRTTVFRYDS